jgi:two-component system sensor histidine kinase/response regulator
MDLKFFGPPAIEYPDTGATGSPVTGIHSPPIGFAVCRDDRTLFAANGALRDMAVPWGGLHTWWQRVTDRVTLPAATQCPLCGMAQMIGTVECVLEMPEPESPAEVPVLDPDPDQTGAGIRYPRRFLVSFSGHMHDVSGTEQGDALLVHEVTVYDQTVARLQETINHFESLCASIEDVYYRVDNDGRFLFISPSCYHLLAYRPEEIIGTLLPDLCIDPDYWTEVTEILSSVEYVHDFEVVFQCKRGTHVPVTMNGRIVRDGNRQRIGVEGIFRDLSEREQLDSILAERTRQLQEIMAELEHQKFAMDQHALVIMTDPEGRITYANRKMVEVAQYTMGELKHQTPTLLNSGYHPKSFFKELWRVVSAGRVWHGEIRNRRKDGSVFWVDTTIVPFMTPSGKPFRYVSISTDITDRIMAEQRLDRSRSFLLSIADAVGEGVYVLDLQGRVTFFNTEAERLLGWRESEVLGKNLHDTIHFKRKDGVLMPSEDCPVHRSLLGRSFRIDTDYFIRKDGTFLPVSYVTTPLMEGRELTGSVAVFQDISLKLQQDADMRREREGALEASRLKSEFLANMSHEIRTPMNAIIGMNDLLMDTTLSDEQREFAEIVRDSSQSLLSLINDILDFSKIEAGKIDLESIDFALVTVVEGTAELLASQAHDKKVSLMTYVAPEVPRTLRGDPGRLRQLLLNLLSNAMKFTDKGEVVVRARLESSAEQHVMLHVSVSDTGIGLSSKARERLFQPFTQARGDTTRKYGGTGLGLAISKRLVSLMGGEIGVESREGEGSTFWFRVPMLRSHEVEETGSDKLNLEALRDLRFLVVTERDSDREILDGYLGHWGSLCRAFSSADEGVMALRMAEERGRPYDVVLVSAGIDAREEGPFTHLAGYGGGAAAGGSGDRPPRSRFIAVADTDNREWSEAILAQGYAAGIAKPVRQSELVECIVTVVNPSLARPRVEVFTTGDAAVATAYVRGGGSGAIPEPDAYDALESGKLLLLAEDNPVNQKVAMMQLKKLGYAVHVVSNGKEVVEAMTHLPYALILMDCQMPVMDGFEATHAIRRMDRTSSRHIPIIAMTANAMKGDRERCLQAGMDDYLSKPVDPEVLRAKLEYWIPKSIGDLPPIEVSQLHQLFGQDDEMVREMLYDFLPEARALVLRIRECVRQEDLLGLADASHELRGACVNVGASAMARITRRMERAGGASNWEETHMAMESLDKALLQVEHFIRKY